MAGKIKYQIDENGCHICTSHKPNGDGYPYNYIAGKHWRTSRYIYIITYGEIPKGLIVRHTCDVRLCINPNHLVLGTKKENAEDRSKRGRNRNQNGENNDNNKLTEQQVLEILLSKKSDTKTAKDYNVSQGLVSRIKRRVRWKHITQKQIDEFKLSLIESLPVQL